MIPPRSLSIISNRLLKENGGKRIPERTIELDYCLAWFLSELAEHPISNQLAFKGGTCLRRCHFGEYRFSEDLDFTLLSNVSLDEIKMGLKEIFAKVKAASGIAMTLLDKYEAHLNSHTLYMSYVGPLGRASEVKIDATVCEKIVTPLVGKPVIKTYNEYTDLPDERVVMCYSIEEIVVEKIAALSDKARKQPRDLYDLWYLTEDSPVDLAELRLPLVEKFEHKSRVIDGIEASIVGKESELKKLWKARLEAQVSQLPEFDEAFRAVRRTLRQANLEEYVEASAVKQLHAKRKAKFDQMMELGEEGMSLIPVEIRHQIISHATAFVLSGSVTPDQKSLFDRVQRRHLQAMAGDEQPADTTRTGPTNEMPVIAMPAAQSLGKQKGSAHQQKPKPAGKPEIYEPPKPK